MGNDILFHTDDFIFSYRVGGLLLHDSKILLQRPKGDDFAIIGGHVSRFETTAETLRREFLEEIRAEIETDGLLAVSEIFFPWGKRPCHQIALYYWVHLLKDSIPLDGSFWGYDELGGVRTELEYCWVPLEELRRGLKVYPAELVPYILNPPEGTVHFISKQL